MQVPNIVTKGRLTNKAPSQTSGQGSTMNEIRSSGYWLLDSNAAVKGILYNFFEFCIDTEKD